MNCPYCQHHKYYILQTDQYKCTKCKRKYSPKKIELKQNLISAFCKDQTVLHTSQYLNLSHITVQKYFSQFRSSLISFLEEQYERFDTQEYDEYVYLERSKAKVKENIFDAHNFLTFQYNDTQVYNLLMPDLNRYKEQFLDDEAQTVYFKEFSKFMLYNRIAKTQKKDNTIVQFWEYFENFILKYKGIKRENFFSYLKECEFKFNYKYEERIKILSSLNNLRQTS